MFNLVLQPGWKVRSISVDAVWRWEMETGDDVDQGGFWMASEEVEEAADGANLSDIDRFKQRYHHRSNVFGILPNW